MTVLGLHPNTKDQAVIKYLDAHGEVNKTEKVIHHVFPGTPGSTLCAGKFNGNRSYVMKVKEPLGSFHIIDGEKVTVRYRGQEWSCARCHQFKRFCPGLAIARECTAERVLLSTHMTQHWERIGFKPDIDIDKEVDDLPDLEIQVGHSKKVLPVIPNKSLCSKYKSVIIKGFLPDTPIENVLKELPVNVLPEEYSSDNVLRNEKTGAVTLANLESDQCLAIMESMHAKKFLGRKIFITSVIPASPTKNQTSADGSTAQISSNNAGNLVIHDSNSCVSLPNISSPVADPKACLIEIILRLLSFLHL